MFVVIFKAVSWSQFVICCFRLAAALKGREAGLTITLQGESAGVEIWTHESGVLHECTEKHSRLKCSAFSFCLWTREGLSGDVSGLPPCLNYKLRRSDSL